MGVTTQRLPDASGSDSTMRSAARGGSLSHFGSCTSRSTSCASVRNGASSPDQTRSSIRDRSHQPA